MKNQKKALAFNRWLPGLKLPDTNGGNARASSAEGYTRQKLPTSVDEVRTLSERTIGYYPETTADNGCASRKVRTAGTSTSCLSSST